MSKIFFRDVEFRNGKPLETLVYHSPPSARELHGILHNRGNHTTNVWTVSALKGLKDYSPTVFNAATRFMGLDLVETTFGYTDPFLEENAILLQLQSELDSKAATTDAAIITGRCSQATVDSKVRHLTRLYTIGRRNGLLRPQGQIDAFIEQVGDTPTYEGGKYFAPFIDPTTIKDKTQWNTVLSAVKKQFVELIQDVNPGRRLTEKPVRRGVDVSEQELEKRFGYVSWLQEKLEDNLVGVLLYGSAATTEDPTKYHDFDNWVKVHDIERAHQQLEGANPVQTTDGKVYSLPLGEDPKDDAKPIGIHLMPNDHQYMSNYVRFLHNSRERLESSRVLYGNFDFPQVSDREIVERGLSQGHIKMRVVTAALNWGYQNPEKLAKSPALFDFVVKNVRFAYGHILNATEGIKQRGKDEMSERLAEKGLFVPPHKTSHSHIKGALLYAAAVSYFLQDEFIQSGHRPDFSFLDNTSNGFYSSFFDSGLKGPHPTDSGIILF